MSGFRAELQQLKDCGNKHFCYTLSPDVARSGHVIAGLTFPAAAFGTDTRLPVPATPGDALPAEVQAAHDALRDTVSDKLFDLSRQLFEVGERLIDIAETYEWLDEKLS